MLLHLHEKTFSVRYAQTHFLSSFVAHNWWKRCKRAVSLSNELKEPATELKAYNSIDDINSSSASISLLKIDTVPVLLLSSQTTKELQNHLLVPQEVESNKLPLACYRPSF